MHQLNHSGALNNTWETALSAMRFSHQLGFSLLMQIWFHRKETEGQMKMDTSAPSYIHTHGQMTNFNWKPA